MKRPPALGRPTTLQKARGSPHDWALPLALTPPPEGGHVETPIPASPQSLGFLPPHITTLVTTQAVCHGASWGSAGESQAAIGQVLPAGSLWGLGVGAGSRLHWRGFGARGAKEDADKTPHGSGSAP